MTGTGAGEGAATGAAGSGKGRRVLVTGASSGIGAATARLLAAEGWTVGLVARRPDRLDEVLADCRRTSPDSQRWAADLADPTHAAEVVIDIWDSFGPLDCLINNAGVPMRRPVTRLTMDEVTRTMTINYLSPVAIMLALLPRMIERGGGTIVNVSSLAGRLGVVTEAAYSGSKFALAGFSEAAAADLDGTGVKVRLVLPGAIESEIWDQPGNDAPLYTGPFTPAADAARGIVDCIDSDKMEHYIPDLKAIVEMKTSDIDMFFAGMRAMREGEIDAKSVADATTGGPLPEGYAPSGTP